MKRKLKESDTVRNKHGTKKSKTTESTQDEEIVQTFERRRQELFELVSKENELCEASKKKNVKDIACEVNYPSSESEDDLNNEERKNFEKFKVKEKQRTIESVEVIIRKQALDALSILEVGSKKSKKKLTDEEKRLNNLKKHCNNQHPDHTWDSVMYIVKDIRASILTRNWDNLTHLLLLLLKHDKSYIGFVRQVTFLNLMRNPSDINGEILNELYKLFKISEN